MTKAVVFDMGGVLIDLDIDRAKRAFRENAGFERIDEFLDCFHQKGILHDLEGGLISEDEFFEQVKAYCRPGITKDLLVSCFEDFLVGIHPDKVRIIQQLYGKYDLYLLSNNNPYSMIGCTRMMDRVGIPIDKYFKKRFISSEMKLLKPCAEIYNIAISEIGRQPAEILFLDDSQRNVDGALDLGIDARLCGGIDDFIAIFAGLI